MAYAEQICKWFDRPVQQLFSDLLDLACVLYGSRVSPSAILGFVHAVFTDIEIGVLLLPAVCLLMLAAIRYCCCGARSGIHYFLLMLC